MADDKLLCALVLRLRAGENATVVAKFDHATQSDRHHDPLYEGQGTSFSEHVKNVIHSDPPSRLTDDSPGTLGVLKFVHSERHQFVYGVDGDGICVAVVTGLAYPVRVATQMVQELYNNFMSKFASKVSLADENGLSKKAKKILSDICQTYDDLESVDKISSVRGKVDVIKSQMEDNITQQYENVVNTVSVVSQAEDLNESAKVFKVISEKLRKQMACKYIKMTLICGGIVALILTAFLVPLIKKH